jgi:hypothetical protein
MTSSYRAGMTSGSCTGTPKINRLKKAPTSEILPGMEVVSTDIDIVDAP